MKINWEFTACKAVVNGRFEITIWQPEHDDRVWYLSIFDRRQGAFLPIPTEFASLLEAQREARATIEWL